MDTLLKFYSSLRFHLSDSAVESQESLSGCSNKEIEMVESKLGIIFPIAYKLFLENFGEKANFHDFQEYQPRFLSDAQEVIQDMASRNKLDFQDILPFSQWQGYSVFCLSLRGDNPEVLLFVEGDSGLEIYRYSSFTNWLLDRIKTHLKYLSLAASKTKFLEAFLTESALVATS
jgi:hypothetical protein